MNSLKKEAQKLRDQGYSYSLIHEELGVPQSTLSNWFKDRPFQPNNEVLKRIKNGPLKAARIRHDLRIKQTQEIKEKATKELGVITPRDVLMAGIGLYIGEGSKSIESVRIMNSDPEVITFAIRWFQQACGLQNQNIMVSLFLYPDSDEKTALEYWQRVTRLPAKNFRKTQIDTRQNKRKSAHGKLPYGTVQLRINANGNAHNGVVLFRRIGGWMEAILSQV